MNAMIEHTDPGYSSTRLLFAALAVFATLVTTGYLVPQTQWLVATAIGVLVPILVIASHWLALPWRTQERANKGLGGYSAAAVFMLAGAAVVLVNRDADEWYPQLPITMIAYAAAWTMITFYARRSEQMACSGSMDRLSADGIRAHFGGYAFGLAAGLAAVAAKSSFQGFGSERDWLFLWNEFTFAIAFALGKLVVDWLNPLARPFRHGTMSGSFLRMTVLSPLWWGVPIGVVVAANNALMFHTLDVQDLAGFATEAAQTVAQIATATTLVFASLTALIFAAELFSPRQGEHDRSDPAQVPDADWVRLYVGVVTLAIALQLWIYSPKPTSDQELFGIETWKCAHEGNAYKLGWIADDGVHITNERGGFDFFNLDCVPRTGWRGGCKYDKDVWDEVSFAISRGGQSRIFSFRRNDPDVQYGGLYGKSAIRLLEALYDGESAILTVKAPGGRIMYSMHISLKGFQRELDKCVVQWNRTPPPAR